MRDQHYLLKCYIAVLCFRVDEGPALPAEMVPETTGALQESHQGARHDVLLAQWRGLVCPHPLLPPRPRVGVMCHVSSQFIAILAVYSDPVCF